MTLQFVPTTERFPRISEVKTQIYELEKELREVTIKEELKFDLRGALLGVSATEGKRATDERGGSRNRDPPKEANSPH